MPRLFNFGGRSSCCFLWKSKVSVLPCYNQSSGKGDPRWRHGKELSQDNLEAAQALLAGEHWRSSVSRFYYAAYCAVSQRLAEKGVQFARLERSGTRSTAGSDTQGFDPAAGSAASDSHRATAFALGTGDRRLQAGQSCGERFGSRQLS